MKDSHQKHIDLAKANQHKMQDEEQRIKRHYSAGVTENLVDLVPQLKSEYRSIVHQSKEFRYIRQTKYY